MQKSDRNGKYYVMPEDADALQVARDAAVVAARDMVEECDDGWSYWAHVYNDEPVGYRVGILVEDDEGRRLGVITA